MADRRPQCVRVKMLVNQQTRRKRCIPRLHNFTTAYMKPLNNNFLFLRVNVLMIVLLHLITAP